MAHGKPKNPNWGGARPGAGRRPTMAVPKPRPKPERSVAETKVKPSAPAEAAQSPSPQELALAWAQLLPQIESISRQYAERKSRTAENNPFRLPAFPPEAIPPDKGAQMAMDDSMSWCGSQWLDGEAIAGVTGEGMLFLGYPYLAELAQRSEFRQIAETIADDATRKWIDFDVVGDEKKQREAEAKDPEGFLERMADPDERKKRVASAGKTDRVKQLKDHQASLEVQAHFYDQAKNDCLFGRSHLYLDIWTKGEEPSDEELKTDVGTGLGTISATKCGMGCFRRLKTVEPVWAYPQAYNAVRPLKADWYNPQQWYVMGQEIHRSRLPVFIGHPVPDMLKPAYAFGGLSMTQMAKPYVDIWLQTRQSVADLIRSFSVMVLLTDLSTLIQPGNASALLARVAMFNMMRDNMGTFVANKNSEDFKNVSAQLSGLHELQAQSQEHICSVTRIPLVKYTGISPSGLNATSEFELEVYDDTMGAYQARFMDPNLRTVIRFEMLSLWGEIDPEITHRWEPLRQMTEKERGEKQKADSERDKNYVDLSAISPAEVRKRIINDPDLPYTGLDPDDLPEPPAEEGLLGSGAGGAAAAFEKDKLGQPQGKEGAAHDGTIPFAQDADWNEGDHPRDKDGKFGSGSGSTPTAPSESLRTAISKTRAGPAIAAASDADGKFRDADKKMAAVVKHIRQLHERRDAITEIGVPDGYSAFEDAGLGENGEGEIDLIIDNAREAGRTKVDADQVAPELDPDELREMSAAEKQQFDMIGQRLKALYAVAKDRSRDLAKAALGLRKSQRAAAARIEALTDQMDDIPRKDWEPWMIAAEALTSEDDVGQIGTIVDYLSGNPLSDDQAASITDMVDQFRAQEEFEALPPEEQRRIIAAQEEEERRVDAENTEEINAKVDAAIKSGWWPEVDEGVIRLGRNMPTDLQEYASPRSMQKIRDRFVKHLMGEIGTGQIDKEGK